MAETDPAESPAHCCPYSSARFTTPKTREDLGECPTALKSSKSLSSLSVPIAAILCCWEFIFLRSSDHLLGHRERGTGSSTSPRDWGRPPALGSRPLTKQQGLRYPRRYLCAPRGGGGGIPGEARLASPGGPTESAAAASPN